MKSAEKRMKELQLRVFTINISNLKVDLRETQLINTMLGLGLFHPHTMLSRG